jgi:ABC-type phosphate transport system substrate-binding protein
MNRSPRLRGRTGWWLAGVLLAAMGLIACSVLVDHGAKQCSIDADCTRLAGMASAVCDIKTGVCVHLTATQRDCIPGPATQPEDFARVCTSAECVPFDNCAHGLCDGADAGVVDGGLIAPPPPTTQDAGTTSSPDAGVVHLPACTAGNDQQQVIYVTGSSNFPPLLAKLGPLIMGQTGYTPVYQISSSCNGVKSVFSTVAKDRIMADPAAGSKTATATYVTADGTLVPCALGAGGVTVDVGESDIFSSSCATFGDPPAGVAADYQGPIQAMLFVVPGGSLQDAISAQMARAVFGRGGDNGKAMPWTDPTLYFVRNANTGTQQMIGRAINVPAEQFWGVDRGTASAVASSMPLVPRSSMEQTIGIISSDYYGRSNGALRELAFQGANHACGYLPDSTRFVADKRNVRDGHYPIWGPLHFFTALSQGLPATPAAAAFVQTVSAEPSEELLNAYVEAGLVPTCAMRVERFSDLGDLKAYAPPIPCGCYFDAHLAGGATPDGCKICPNGSLDCTDPAMPACRFGYCEAR